MQKYKLFEKKLLKKGGTGNTSYTCKIKNDLNNIISKYIEKEKELFNLNKSIYDLGNNLVNRYNNNKNNNFSFPEIKPAFQCIYEILIYFLNETFKDDNIINNIFKWQINQTLDLIQNASQKTICTDTNNYICPIPHTKDTIPYDKKSDIKKYIDNHNNEKCKINIYQTPYNYNIYPYAYCIRVLVQAMNTIDFINIYFKSESSDNIWTSQYASVYFKKRYHFYLDYLLDNAPNVFILPALQSVGATGLLLNRCSRLQPCGLVFDEIFVDEDIQSPSNFFWHDINHARRIYQNNIWYSEYKKMSLDDLYIEMRNTVNELMPINKWLIKDNVKYESMIKILLFEIVHEDALPFVKDQIVNDILFKSGKCYPYERPFNDNDDISSRINLRFYEQGASTLRTLYNKVRHEFFEKEKANDIIVKSDLRYIQPIIHSAYILLNKIDDTINEDIKITLLQLIKDKKYSEHVSSPLENLVDDIDDITTGGKKIIKKSKTLKNNKKINNRKHKV